MKKLILLFFSLVLFNSCSEDTNDNSNKNFQGKWKLIQMSGSVPNSETSGADMFWQEFYQLNSDGTFLKNRQRDGITIEASGSFRIVMNEEEKYLEFTFDSESEIIGSCSGPLKEYMIIQSGTSFYSTWNACDGPGLKYEKQKS